MSVLMCHLFLSVCEAAGTEEQLVVRRDGQGAKLTDAPAARAVLSLDGVWRFATDPDNRGEIEACGGCPDTLVSGTELSVRITTDYRACGTVP